MLSIRNISKVKSETTILDRITFDTPENTITGVIGPNGAGKSTLLRTIAGFENPDEGAVLFHDTALLSFKAKKQLFSYMPEYLELYPEYSVHEFITFVHRASGFSDENLLEALGLEKVLRKKVRHLSKGYKQRLKLYFALCNRKRIVILDEPFDGFDPIQLLEILQLIKRAREEGRTFLISIHQLSDAEKICDHYVLLDEGRIVADGDKESLRRKFGIADASLERIFMEALK
jgi:ABC-2 type transport system ATP-binding protein